jgi:3-oxoacyl-[acyl-carrier-protein] synthase I
MKRVVITGMGVVSPNGVGLKAFEHALRQGISGIKHQPELERLNFACQIAGVPDISSVDMNHYFTELQQKNIKASGIIFGCIAGIDAWEDAGLNRPATADDAPDWDSGCVFGAGLAGINLIREGIYKTDEGNVKRLGSTLIEQTMSSGISAHLGGMLGLGNMVTTNTSACSTGTEAVYLGWQRIRNGEAVRMLVGGCDADGPYVWGGFDSMRVLNRKSNDSPEAGSCPMSVHASGFVPGSGAGALLLEDYDIAMARGAKIYAEVLGGFVNSGGQQQGGTMTAPNSFAIERCINGAIMTAGIASDEIEAISGHLTSTMGDVLEVKNWSRALCRSGANFPYINALKSMTGHCLSAAGAIESVAVALQLKNGFLHPTLNLEEPHPEILLHVQSDKLIREKNNSIAVNIIAKSSFGFGDVNACIIFKKF